MGDCCKEGREREWLLRSRKQGVCQKVSSEENPKNVIETSRNSESFITRRSFFPKDNLVDTTVIESGPAKVLQ